MGAKKSTDLMLCFTVLRLAVRRDLPLSEAVRGMKGEQVLPAATLDAMAVELEEGATLASSVERHPEVFPPPVAALLAVGERSGDLPAAIDRVLDVVRRRSRTRRQLEAALVYPAICLALLTALLVTFAVFDPLGTGSRLVPAAAAARGPTWLEGLWRLGRVVLTGPIGACVAVLVGVFLVGGAWWVFGARRRTLRNDRLRLDLPVAGGLYRTAVAARFVRALAALLQAGLPADRAFESAIPATGNVWVERELRRRHTLLRDGDPLSAAVHLGGVFPPSLELRLAVGEQRGELPRAVADAATSFEETLDVLAGRMARLAEPLAILGVGLIAAVVVGVLFARLLFVFRFVVIESTFF